MTKKKKQRKTEREMKWTPKILNNMHTDIVKKKKGNQLERNSIH